MEATYILIELQSVNQSTNQPIDQLINHSADSCIKMVLAYYGNMLTSKQRSTKQLSILEPELKYSCQIVLDFTIKTPKLFYR